MFCSQVLILLQAAKGSCCHGRGPGITEELSWSGEVETVHRNGIQCGEGGGVGNSRALINIHYA